MSCLVLSCSAMMRHQSLIAKNINFSVSINHVKLFQVISPHWNDFKAITYLFYLGWGFEIPWNAIHFAILHCVGDVGAPQTWSPYPEKLLWVSTMPEEDAVSFSSIIHLSKPLWNRSTELICLIQEHLRSEPEQAPARLTKASWKWEESWTLRVNLRNSKLLNIPGSFSCIIRLPPVTRGSLK